MTPLLRFAMLTALLLALPAVARAQSPTPAPTPTPTPAPSGETAAPKPGELPPLDVELGDSSLLADEIAAPPPTPTPSPSASSAPNTFDLGDARIEGRRRKRALPASEFEVEVGELSAVPHADAAEQLMLAPGVLVTNAGGDGHARDTFMRGFSAGVGQDIETLVDGVPINEVSNAHNHGYVDVLFVPPELVQKVSVTSGSFDPEQGDFAFAGTARYQLGVPERGSRSKLEYGSFDTLRFLQIVAPHDFDAGSFAAFELERSDGFGQNRASQRASGLARYNQDDGTAAFRWSATVAGYGARWDQAGVIRQDDFESGAVGFYDSYDSNQGGESKRLLVSWRGAVGPTDRELSQSVYLGLRQLRMRENFTGFTLDTTNFPQRGDGIEQRYEALTVGGRGRYSLATTLWGETQELSAGYSVRYDRGRTRQLRLRSVSAIPYLRTFDREIEVANIAGWLRTQLRPLSWLALRGGLRIETFSFGVNDLNQPENDPEGVRVDSQSAQAFGFAINPRVSLELRPLDRLSVVGSYGQGTRSTDGAALSDNETAPFARAQEAEVGVTWQVGEPGKAAAELKSAYVYAAIDKDLVFEPSAGRNILVGASTRHAFLLALRGDLGGYLDALFNLGVTDARLDATDERIPYVPEVVGRLDVALHGQLFDWKVGAIPVRGRMGLGFTFVPGRPLPERGVGDAFYLLGLAASVRLHHFELGLEARNLLDLQYRQSEFNYASNFRGAGLPGSRLSERHFVAGEPLFVGGSLTIYLEDLLTNRKPDPEAE